MLAAFNPLHSLRFIAGNGFIGFAVGRSTFLQTIKDLQAGTISKQTGAQQVSEKFLHWIDIYEKARA